MDDDDSLTLEEELLALGNTIEDLASTSVCNEATECKYIGYGSKPCGEPSTYLIYSTSIDIEKLEQMVAEYNQKSSDLNIKLGRISDCMFVSPPVSLNCENNTCVAVY